MIRKGIGHVHLIAVPDSENSLAKAIGETHEGASSLDTLGTRYEKLQQHEQMGRYLGSGGLLTRIKQSLGKLLNIKDRGERQRKTINKYGVPRLKL